MGVYIDGKWYCPHSCPPVPDPRDEEVKRLREVLEQLAVLGEQGMRPDPTRWVAFHDEVANIARAALKTRSET